MYNVSKITCVLRSFYTGKSKAALMHHGYSRVVSINESTQSALQNVPVGKGLYNSSSSIVLAHYMYYTQ